MAGGPLYGSDFPDFGGEGAAHEVAVFAGKDAHALVHGNGPRGLEGDRFRHAQHGKFQKLRPEIRRGVGGLSHQPSSLKRRQDPEATGLIFTPR
jgi:hypothetical protein